LKLNQNYWNQRYLKNKTGWDIGGPSPALVEYTKHYPKDTRILIPGAGRGHEAIHLSNIGYTQVTVCDFVSTALKYIEDSPKTNPIELIHCNFFEMQSGFDLILEQTFFCALHPDLRKDYVSKMDEILYTSGKIAGVLFSKHFDQPGPPFGGTRLEYQSLFEDKFEILHLEACYNSIPPRQGNELFIEFQKKS
jgi:hypothetical protein